MGQTIACQKCPTAVNHSVITFSEPLILKLLEGKEPEPLTEEELRNNENEDSQWFEKLKCIDDSHSQAYGLTPENFDNLVRRIQKLAGNLDSKAQCDLKMVVDCYKKSPECTIKCSDATKKYQDCVDGTALKKLVKKSKVSEETASKAKK